MYLDVPEEKYLIEKMTSPEVREALKETGIVIVHVGSMEQHGPHLPINTDTVIGFEVSKRAATKFYKETGKRVLLTPSIRIAMSLHHMNYPGTMSLRPDTLVKILVEVCLGLEHQGFKKILITNSHGGNSLWLNVAAREIFDKLTSAKIFLWGTVWSKNKENNWEDYLKSGRTGSGHAGETETSIMMALDTPVRLDVMPREPTKWKNPFTDFWSHDPDGPKISGLATIGTYNVEDICDSYMGDPTHSLKETGEKILENWSNNLLEFIKQYHEYN